jgi:hypothetical protein
MPESPVLQIERRYQALEARVDFCRQDAHGRLVRRLVLNDEMYDRFAASPIVTASAEDVELDEAGAERLLAMAGRLRVRVRRDLQPVKNDILSSSSTSTNENTNFDNSTSWFLNHGGYHFLWSKGHSNETSTGSVGGTTQNFGGLPVEEPQFRTLQSFRARFYPGQPLVSPDLVEEIRDRLKQRP